VNILKKNVDSNYEILRKKTKRKNKTDLILGKKSKSMAEDHDDQIYNDEDFYSYLLKEFINNKDDYVENLEPGSSRYDLTLKYIMNRNKNKSNKNVDKKASKNRKLRFEKQEKIINFMVPIINYSLNTGRDDIIKSIFGKLKRAEQNMETTYGDEIELI